MRELMDTAKAFVAEHAVQCARELIEWQDTTSLLPNGKVRELANMLKPLGAHNALALAEALVKRAALDIAAKQGGDHA